MGANQKTTRRDPAKWITNIRNVISEELPISFDGAVIVASSWVPSYVAYRAGRWQKAKCQCAIECNCGRRTPVKKSKLARDTLKRFIKAGVFELHDGTISKGENNEKNVCARPCTEAMRSGQQTFDVPDGVQAGRYTWRRYVAKAESLGWVRLKGFRGSVTVTWIGPDDPDPLLLTTVDDSRTRGRRSCAELVLDYISSNESGVTRKQCQDTFGMAPSTCVKVLRKLTVAGKICFDVNRGERVYRMAPEEKEACNN
jgi:hypothetical protein